MKVAGREPRVRRQAGWQECTDSERTSPRTQMAYRDTEWGQAAAALTKGCKDHHNERRRWKRERPCTRVS